MEEYHDEGMNVAVIGIELEVSQRSIDMPISIDGVYNLIICTDCGIGVLFEWVPSHFKNHHGIKATGGQVLEFLSLESNAMTTAQAEDWIQSVWVGRSLQNIPVVRGYRCNDCQYSAAAKNAIKNHFSKQHKGLKRVEHSQECKVQLVFKGHLRKYIQVEEYNEMEVDSGSDSDWKRAVEMDFTESMANVKILSTDEEQNLRLVNVFIAKTRWDVMMEGKDLKEVVTLAGAPPSNQNL
jgi:Orsellinic acid/F9775 biosynthesis cluster protein D